MPEKNQAATLSTFPAVSVGIALNREGWLTVVAAELRPIFKGLSFSPFKVSCSWPSRGAVARQRRVVGQCFGAQSSKAGINELFISPLLDNPIEVAGTLTHEMTHVIAGVEAAHGPTFVKVCKMVGLTKGKPTTAMSGEKLEERIRRIVERAGPYPHSAIIPVYREKRVSSVVRLECPCGFAATTSIKRLSAAGVPTCGCGNLMEIANA